MSILIVDDSNFQRAALQRLLETEGYTDTLTAKSAAEALELLENSTEIDLVLLDVEMDGIDGIVTCSLIKAMEPYRDLPVIIITASTDPATLRRAFEAGALDYITKPPEALNLGVRVGGALRLKGEIDQRKARERDLTAANHKLTRANNILRRLAVIDGLTGVANRRFFDETMEQEWRRSIAEGTPMALIMADVDHFKAYNDTYGHQQGDACLKAVAGAMQGCLRRAQDIIARYGGEEFVVVMPGADLDGARRMAECMRRAVKELNMEHSGSSVADHVTISLGAASAYPAEDRDSAELVRLADANLYKAKELGRNRVQAS